MANEENDQNLNSKKSQNGQAPLNGVAENQSDQKSKVSDIYKSDYCEPG